MNPVFYKQDAANLSKRGLMKPSGRGRRAVNSSVVLGEGSGSSEDSTESGYASGYHFIIPEFLESSETLEYLGFEESKASDIWAKWGELKHWGLQDFLEFALDDIPFPRLDNKHEDWEAEMVSWGVREELIKAIMDSKYENVRLTETPEYWVKDTMSIRYLTLERLQRESKDRHNRQDTNRSGSQVATSSSRRSTVPGTLVLFKATEETRVMRNPAGNILLQPLVSPPPTDFCGFNGVTLYFTPSLEVAEHYGGYIRRRDGAGHPVMIEMSIANSYIEGLPPYILEFGDLWKEIVFTSRRGDRLTGNLKRVRQYPLLIGPIAHSHNQTISTLGSYHEISMDRHVLVLNGKEAKQYVFQGEEQMDDLQEQAEITCYKL